MTAIDQTLVKLMPDWIRHDEKAAAFVLSTMTREEKIEVLRPVLDCFSMKAEALKEWPASCT